MPENKATQSSPESPANPQGAPVSNAIGNHEGEYRFHCAALATDYDGTIATHGIVGEETRAALLAFRVSGRKLILVTGRRIADLATVYEHLPDFDVIVAENGALLYWPEEGREEPLGEPPDPRFLEFLIKAEVRPIEKGVVIVATYEPHQNTVLDAIKNLGLELQVIFNKGAVMVLPTGINKATGLKRALKSLNIRPKDVAGVGDAENDHALLEFCGYSAAVANALPSLKERARCILPSTHGKGVEELIDLILKSEAEGGIDLSAPAPVPSSEITATTPQNHSIA